jgi:hypothetical protein
MTINTQSIMANKNNSKISIGTKQEPKEISLE